MAYDPITGEFKEENTSVEKRLRGLLATDSPYLKQGETEALKAANRRGLLNSSIAVQAGQAARISAALPVASQDASQANQRQMQGRELQTADLQQQRQITSTEKMQGLDIASRERMQGRDIEAQNQLLEKELGSRERLAAAENAAAKERLGMQLTSQEKLAANELKAARERLGMQITSQEKLQTQDLASRERIASLDREAQQRIANLNVSASQQNNAASLATTYEQIYANMVSNITNNVDIPADARQQYLDEAVRMRESNYGLLEQLYGFDLNWG